MAIQFCQGFIFFNAFQNPLYRPFLARTSLTLPTIDSKLRGPLGGPRLVGGGASVLPTVSVTHCRNAEEVGPGPGLGRLDARTGSNAVPVQAPANVKRHVTRSHNARHMGIVALIHGVFAKGEWDYLWRF